MQTLFSPKSLEFRPEHGRSASWFQAICLAFSQPKLDLTCHLQQDGSQIFKFDEYKGKPFVYSVQVWPNGDIKGGREIPVSE